MKRVLWFVAAWACAMVFLAISAWILSVGASGMTSYRFFGFFASLLTFTPLGIACAAKGMDQ